MKIETDRYTMVVGFVIGFILGMLACSAMILAAYNTAQNHLP